MFRGYWRVILAVAGLVLAANAQPISQNTGSKTATAQGNKKTENDTNIAARYTCVWTLCSTMRAENATDTLEMALAASGCDPCH